MKVRKVLSLAILAALGSQMSAQNVGIGTSTPLDKLHVIGNVRVSALAGANTRIVGADLNGSLQIVASGSNGQVLTQTAGGPVFQSASSDWTLLGNAGTNASTNFIGTTDGVDFATRTSNTERMRVTAGGLVGINVASPAALLHVAGDVRVGPNNPANTGVLPGYGDRLYFSGGPAGASYNSENSDPIWFSRYNLASDQTELRLNLSDNCSSLDAFVIQTGGSGCGVTDYFRFDGSGAAFKIGGGSWSTLSDQRLKQNVNAFQDGLATLEKIRPVTFQYNGLAGTPDNGKVYTGVIAQELQAAAPYMVDATGKYLTVDPSAFTYILINGMKEQQAQIQAQQAQIDAMRKEIDALKAK